jgi:hypothetical protein
VAERSPSNGARGEAAAKLHLLARKKKNKTKKNTGGFFLLLYIRAA